MAELRFLKRFDIFHLGMRDIALMRMR